MERRLVRIDPQILNPRDYVIVDGQAIRRISGGMPQEGSFLKNEPSVGPLAAQANVQAATETTAETATGLLPKAALYEEMPFTLLASTVSQSIFIADDNWQVVGVQVVPNVIGGAGATVTVEVCTGLTAPGSGVAQLSAALVIGSTATAHKVLAGALIAAPTTMQKGDRLGIVMAGTLTGLVGMLTIAIKRV